jgi:hypothetical protein
MEKISWTDKITNENTLDRIFVRNSIWNSILKKRNKIIDHILRHAGLLGLILEGIIDGKVVKEEQHCNTLVR